MTTIRVNPYIWGKDTMFFIHLIGVSGCLKEILNDEERKTFFEKCRNYNAVSRVDKFSKTLNECKNTLVADARTGIKEIPDIHMFIEEYTFFTKSIWPLLVGDLEQSVKEDKKFQSRIRVSVDTVMALHENMEQDEAVERFVKCMELMFAVNGLSSTNIVVRENKIYIDAKE